MISNINIEQRKKDLAQIPQFINDIEFDYKFQEYSAIYYLTNEKLANLYNEINFTKYKTALTVLASGDQAFNLILEGAERIDTFDCNRLAEYYALGFKKTAIQCLGYKDFNNLFYLRQKKLYDLESEVIKHMPEEYRTFWKEYREVYRQYYPYPSVLGLAKEHNFPNGNNIYFSKESYKYLQKRLNEVLITFTYAEVKQLPEVFGQYDFIYLSNILSYDHWVFNSDDREYLAEQYTKFVLDIYTKNLNQNGLLIYNYGFNGLTDKYCSKEIVERKVTYDLEKLDRAHGLRKLK